MPSGRLIDPEIRTELVGVHGDIELMLTDNKTVSSAYPHCPHRVAELLTTAGVQAARL